MTGTGPDDWLEVEAALLAPNGQVANRAVLAVPVGTSFRALAVAIQEAFAIGEVAGAHEFLLPDGRVVGASASEWGEPPVERSDAVLVADRAGGVGDRFEYRPGGAAPARVRCRVLGRRRFGRPARGS